MDRERDMQLLSDYLDGSLQADEQDALRARLRQDPALRQELAQLRALLDEAAKMPREVTPERDLWPEISETIVGAEAGLWRSKDTDAHSAAERGVWITRTRAQLTRQWRPLLAAAAVLILIFLAPHLNREDSRAPDLASGSAWQELDLQVGGPRTILVALALECAPPLAPEVSHLTSQDKPLSHSSRGIMAHNQRIVDLALADLNAAWLANPHDPHLRSLLTKAYRARVLLRCRAVELATQI
jgi:hypothetical protein